MLDLSFLHFWDSKYDVRCDAAVVMVMVVVAAVGNFNKIEKQEKIIEQFGVEYID